MADDTALLAIGMERGGDGGWMAHCFDYPGATVKAPDERLAQALVAHFVIEEAAALGERAPVGTTVVERVETPHAACRAGDTEAMFDVWRTPLADAVWARGRNYLAWSRSQLLALWNAVPDEMRDWRPLPDKRSIAEIVSHVADAEDFYLVRLSPTGAPVRELWQRHARRDAPVEARLTTIRADLLDALENVPRSRVAVHDPDGETWTPAKVLYRAIWHERHHTRQIRRFLVS
ncbi:MAG: DinB family protein [Firmicutes bacterium]|nr:DinB family protein [Bacillota bacterium]